MAEARSGTQQPSLTLQAGLNVTPLVDFARATRRSLVRNSFRIRNRVRDNLWPLSAWYLSMLLLVVSALLIEEKHCPTVLATGFTYVQNFLQLDNERDDVVHFSRPAQVALCAVVCGIATLLALALVRQTALKCLLTWKGWLYQDPGRKRGNIALLMWGLAVRLFTGPTPSLYSFQRCLPRLPVPQLSATIVRFLDSMRPLLSKTEYEELQVEAHKFEKEKGVQLQRILWLKSWWASNYVSDWWEQYVYLMGRSSIAHNSNYYALDQWQYIPTPKRSARAAGVIWLIGNFYDQLEHEELKPLCIQNLIPLCMEQYRRALATTRIPGREIDQLKHVDKAKHVVIFYKGSYYRLDLYDKHRHRLSPRQLQYQIQEIVQAVDETGEDDHTSNGSVAALTGAERVVWHEARQTMLQNPLNKKSLEEIETAVIFVSLNEESPATLSQRCSIAFHGDGRNIWYDKSLCMSAYANGRISFNVEHSWGDAPVVGHIMEATFPSEYTMAVYTPDGDCAERCESDRVPWHKRMEQLKKPSKLSWKLSPDVQRTILDCRRTLTSAMDESMFEMFVFELFGKKFITRTAKCSPDSFVQMVLQAAYYRDSGKFVLTYEAAMTRLFRNGRTETIRSVTDQSCQTIRAMESDQFTAKEKHRLLVEACKVHQTVSRDAMSGTGIDRHLFALYVVCKGLGQESDFLKKALSYPWTLSTSQQPMSQLTKPNFCIDDPVVQPQIPLGGGFMAVADDGYGVSYQVVSSNRLQFHVSSAKRSARKTDASRMAAHIRQVLLDWKAILEEATADTEKK